MQTKIKTITTIEEDFDEKVNEFTKDKKVVATQTHVTQMEAGLFYYTAVIYYQE